MFDFLATETLSALAKTDMQKSWIDDKERDLKGLDRLEVLRSFSSFDSENLMAVCEKIGVSFDDMQATLRVLKKI